MTKIASSARDTSRRAFLKGAPVAGLALAAGSVVSAATVDPIIAQYDDWVALHDFINSGNAPKPDVEFDALVNDLIRKGKAIMESHPVTPAGAAAQLECALADDCFDNSYADERDKTMARNIIAFLRTL